MAVKQYEVWIADLLMEGSSNELNFIKQIIQPPVGTGYAPEYPIIQKECGKVPN